MTKTCPHCHATVLSTSQPDAMREALKECAIRCRYDGDLFHDQGNEMRRDASWRAADMANAALAAAPAVPPNCKHPGHQCFHYGLCTDTDCRNYGTSVLPAAPAVGGEELAKRLDNMARYQQENLTGKGRFNNFLNGNLALESAAFIRSAAPPASPLRGITDEMLNAHLKATAEWVDPYEAATECGVAIECGITQDEADQLNAQSRASLRVGYAAAFASPPEQPAADPFQPHENCNCLMCIAEKSR